MRYLLTFMPWIAFAAISGAGWNWAALTALVVALLLIARQRRSGTASDALILEISSATFFAVTTAIAFAAPHSTLRPYAGAVALGWLALTAWATLAAGRPFTLGIARQSVPSQWWDNPAFLRVNVVITRVWAAAFTVSCAAMSAAVATGAGAAGTVTVQVLGFVVPMAFTARYPAYVQARANRHASRHAAQQGVSQTPR
jgi:hypothetical protein